MKTATHTPVRTSLRPTVLSRLGLKALLFGGLLSLGLQAWAADEAATVPAKTGEKKEAEKSAPCVQNTGTRLPSKRCLPGQVVTADEIRMTGANSAGQALSLTVPSATVSNP